MKFNWRFIIFGFIIFICIFDVNFAIFWKYIRKTETPTNNNIVTPAVDNETLDNLEKDFSNIFSNSLDYQGYNVNTIGVIKKDNSKDLIFTLVSRKEIIENRYDIDLQIPRINISNPIVDKFNEKIEGLFINKANDVILNATNNTIYRVEYMGYINSNILSLVIKSTLKEGNNPQRVIIQTYNYNLSTNEEMTLNQLIEIQGLNKSAVENKIINKINSSNNDAETLKRLGYNVYIRNTSSDIYKVENTSNFILGKDNHLYILYPYGNSNFTDVVDVIIF